MWIWSLEEEETRDDEMKHIVFAGLFVCSAISFQSFVSHYDDIAGTSVLYPTEKNPPSCSALSTNFSIYTALSGFLSCTWNFGFFAHFNLKVP